MRRLVLLFVVFAAPGCSNSTCEKQVTYAAPAPDGASIAFIYNRTCGATRHVSTHVSIIAFDASLGNEPGNVLVVGDEQPVKVKWQSARKLIVSGFHDPTYRRPDPVASTSIEFAAVVATEPR